MESVRAREQVQHRANGEAAYFSQATVSRIEIGTRRVYAHEAVLLAQVFGVSLDALLDPPIAAPDGFGEKLSAVMSAGRNRVDFEKDVDRQLTELRRIVRREVAQQRQQDDGGSFETPFWLSYDKATSTERDSLIGGAVKQLRADTNQAEVAARMRRRGHSWTQGTVWSIEAGVRPLRLKEAFDLGLVLCDDVLGMVRVLSAA